MCDLFPVFIRVKEKYIMLSINQIISFQVHGGLRIRRKLQSLVKYDEVLTRLSPD